jgi:hypothetical protein
MPLRREPSPRYKIKVLSKQLRKLTFPTSPISVKLATFAADAFDTFLAGKSRTLNAAFGLQKKRGVPGWPKARLTLAKAVYALRKAGHSWTSVLDELSKQGFGEMDPSTLKRTYNELKVRLMARDVALTLSRDSDLYPPTTTRKHTTRK